MLENKFMKSNVKFGTKEIWEWECLTPTVFYKEEFRLKIFAPTKEIYYTKRY